MRAAVSLCLVVPLLGVACGGVATPLTEAAPGEPLPGLSRSELTRFAAGRALFNRAFTPEEGLGPLFNQRQCSACHDLPTSGGHGAELVRKATRFGPDQTCSLLPGQGGDLLQASVTSLAREGGVRPERIPADATATVEMVPPPLYGLGLVEAVSVEEIRARADPLDRDGDGISGRLGMVEGGDVGLFGMKGTHGSLLTFIDGAAHGELGLTTPSRPGEERPQGNALPPGVDPVADPEVDDLFLGVLTDYVRFLAPPPQAASDDIDETRSRSRGERLFGEIGCADCHTPTWTTAKHASPALANRRFRAYSDFLLHDMGRELADICAPGVSPSEWRTARLTGLSLRRVFMHHGLAQTLDAAVGLHGGEAAASAAAYRSLADGGRADLLRFLQSL